MTTPLDNTTLTILGVVALMALLALAAWIGQRRKQSGRLQQRFGSEYARTVDHLGSRDKAEAELLDREKRVERLHIVALSPQDAARYAQEWKLLQSRFVDSPRGTLADADRLVRELMLQRGYPRGDFERRAADISVDHAAVIDHYRAAHAITLRDQNAAADTEELRKAVMHYRALFSELLEVAVNPNEPAHHHPETTRHMETRS